MKKYIKPEICVIHTDEICHMSNHSGNKWGSHSHGHHHKHDWNDQDDDFQQNVFDD